MSGSISIAYGSEVDLQSAVANVGPIAVAVDASSKAFRVCLCVCVFACKCVCVCVCVSQYSVVIVQYPTTINLISCSTISVECTALQGVLAQK